MVFYRTTNSSNHARLSEEHTPSLPVRVFACPIISRAYYKTPCPSGNPARMSEIYVFALRFLLPFTLHFQLCTLYCLFPRAAATPPQLLLRHPPPQQLRLFVAPNQPFSPFCRSCQVPYCGVCKKHLLQLQNLQNFPQIVQISRRKAKLHLFTLNRLPLPNLTTFANVPPCHGERTNQFSSGGSSNKVFSWKLLLSFALSY